MNLFVDSVGSSFFGSFRLLQASSSPLLINGERENTAKVVEKRESAKRNDLIYNITLREIPPCPSLSVFPSFTTPLAQSPMRKNNQCDGTQKPHNPRRKPTEKVHIFVNFGFQIHHRLSFLRVFLAFYGTFRQVLRSRCVLSLKRNHYFCIRIQKPPPIHVLHPHYSQSRTQRFGRRAVPFCGLRCHRARSPARGSRSLHGAFFGRCRHTSFSPHHQRQSSYLSR